jgi:tetratricopeptide (TPR) repeat protein
LVKYALSPAQPSGQEDRFESRRNDEFLQVESHLSVCPSCNLRVKAYRQLYQTNSVVSADIVADDSPLSECIDESGPAIQIIRSRSHSAYRRAAMVAAVLLFAVGLSTLIADHFTRPAYYGLASVRSDRYDQIILYRERSSLLQAIFLFRSGNYERAIPAIEASISTRDGYNMRPYLRLMQGLAYLKLAESNTYGLFPRFDMNRVEAAIVTFQACIDEAASPEMAGVRASAYIYQAKAYLMSGNIGAAQQALREAAGADDELAEQAGQLLDELLKTKPESVWN